MLKNYIFTTNQGKKIVARLLEREDKWGVDGQYSWDNDDLDIIKEYKGDGIEFYLYDEHRGNYKLSTDNWITRFYVNDFIQEVQLSDAGEIIIGYETDYILSKADTRNIIIWLKSMKKY